MRTLARLVVAALVITAVVALWWLDAAREASEVETADAGERHEPDYYFDDFRLRAHGGAGGPGYVLEGRRLLHYADDGSAEVTAPRLRYRPADGDPWRARGNTGVLAAAGDRLDIDGDVVLVRDPPAGGPTVMETAHLTVFTEAGRAETDRPVEATGTGWRATATGLTALFGPGRIELHSNVRMRHDPVDAEDG